MSTQFNIDAFPSDLRNFIFTPEELEDTTEMIEHKETYQQYRPKFQAFHPTPVCFSNFIDRLTSIEGIDPRLCPPAKIQIGKKTNILVVSGTETLKMHLLKKEDILQPYTFFVKGIRYGSHRMRQTDRTEHEPQEDPEEPVKFESLFENFIRLFSENGTHEMRYKGINGDIITATSENGRTIKFPFIWTLVSHSRNIKELIKKETVCTPEEKHYGHIKNTRIIIVYIEADIESIRGTETVTMNNELLDTVFGILGRYNDERIYEHIQDNENLEVQNLLSFLTLSYGIREKEAIAQYISHTINPSNIPECILKFTEGLHALKRNFKIVHASTLSIQETTPVLVISGTNENNMVMFQRIYKNETGGENVAPYTLKIKCNDTQHNRQNLEVQPKTRVNILKTVQKLFSFDPEQSLYGMVYKHNEESEPTRITVTENGQYVMPYIFGIRGSATDMRLIREEEIKRRQNGEKPHFDFKIMSRPVIILYICSNVIRLGKCVRTPITNETFINVYRTMSSDIGENLLGLIKTQPEPERILLDFITQRYLLLIGQILRDVAVKRGRTQEGRTRGGRKRAMIKQREST